MRNGKIVVLQVLAGLNLGGAESRVMDITRNIGNCGFTYDFLLHGNCKNVDSTDHNDKDFYEDEAKNLGCNIYRIPRFRFINYFSYKRAVSNFFAAHPEIDIVQGHITSTAAIYLPIAKKYGIKATIAHARSAGVDAGLKGKLTRFLRRNLYKKTDYMWTCSKEAAVSVFGRENASQARYIPNAILLNKFALTNEIKAKRNEIINNYNLQNKFVVGHVGRFHNAKNHDFLLDIFYEILKIKSNAILMLIGDGENRSFIEEKIKRLGIEDKVILAGEHMDVVPYYRVFDVIIFPSKYEGLPGTIVESQASYVPALCSDAITKDMAVSDYVEYMSLSESPSNWAVSALKLIDKIKTSKDDPVQKLKENAFDVESSVKNLEALYFKINK